MDVDLQVVVWEVVITFFISRSILFLEGNVQTSARSLWGLLEIYYFPQSPQTKKRRVRIELGV
jgi:hypothetical protein